MSISGTKTGSEFAVCMENRTMEQKYSALSPSRKGWSLVSSNLRAGGFAEL
jgi:hypothetical protein